MCDRRSLHDIARQIGISFGAVQSILTRCPRSQLDGSPEMFTKDQKKSRLDILKYLLSLYEDDPEDDPEEFICRV